MQLLKEYIHSLIKEFLEEDKLQDAIKSLQKEPDEVSLATAAILKNYFVGIKPKYIPWIIKRLKHSINWQGPKYRRCRRIKTRH